jgi:hypothetical protein
VGRYRLVAATLACLFVGACHRASYVYAALNGDNVTVVETGRPRHSYWRWGGPIPIRYSVNDPGVSLTISVGSSAFTPELNIVSSVPIRAVEVSHRGTALRRSQSEYMVDWSYWREPDPSPVHVGDAIELKIYLDDRIDPVRVTGTITTSGSIVYSDGL